MWMEPEGFTIMEKPSARVAPPRSLVSDFGPIPRCEQGLVKRPYNYGFYGHFTNLKHRRVETFLQLSSDAAFELNFINGAFGIDQPFLLTCESVGDNPILISLDVTPINPPVRYKPGNRVRFVAQLPDDINIGRSRPRFQVALLGAKVYELAPADGQVASGGNKKESGS